MEGHNTSPFELWEPSNLAQLFRKPRFQHVCDDTCPKLQYARFRTVFTYMYLVKGWLCRLWDGDFPEISILVEFVEQWLWLCSPYLSFLSFWLQSFSTRELSSPLKSWCWSLLTAISHKWTKCCTALLRLTSLGFSLSFFYYHKLFRTRMVYSNLYVWHLMIYYFNMKNQAPERKLHSKVSSPHPFPKAYVSYDFPNVGCLNMF